MSAVTSISTTRLAVQHNLCPIARTGRRVRPGDAVTTARPFGCFSGRWVGEVDGIPWVAWEGMLPFEALVRTWNLNFGRVCATLDGRISVAR